jgi:hypothetical protein
MHYLQETLADLSQRLQLPLLGTMPFAPEGPDDALCEQLAGSLLAQLQHLPNAAL